MVSALARNEALANLCHFVGRPASNACPATDLGVSALFANGSRQPTTPPLPTITFCLLTSPDRDWDLLQAGTCFIDRMFFRTSPSLVAQFVSGSCCLGAMDSHVCADRTRDGQQEVTRATNMSAVASTQHFR